MKQTKKDRRTGKKLSHSLLVLSTGIAALYGYARLVEKRSMRSWVVEKLFWLSGVKKATKEQPQAQFEEILRELASITDQPYELPEGAIEANVHESWLLEMQVFTWNDRCDPKQRIILFLHGSAYVNPPTRFHFQAVDAIARQVDAKVVFPIHPKAPRHTYQDAYPKILELYRQLLASVSTPDQITLMGDSSGGGIALGLAHLLKQEGLAQPKDIILFSPWLDAAIDNPDIAHFDPLDPMIAPWGLRQIGLLWAGGEDRLSDPLVSPLYGEMAGLGKISLYVGTHEMFYPDVRKLDRLLTGLGIPHHTHVEEKMMHDYVLHPIPEAVEAQKMVAATIREDAK